MLLKQYNYNKYRLSLYSDGEIFMDSIIYDIADVPIINELMKDLLEYYTEWKRGNISINNNNFKKIFD